MPEDLPNELPPRWEVDHKIEVKSENEPPSKAPYRLSQKELEELKSQLDELLAKGYIRQSKSPYGALGLMISLIGSRGLSTLAGSTCVQGITRYGLRKGMRRKRLVGPVMGPSSFW